MGPSKFDPSLGLMEYHTNTLWGNKKSLFFLLSGLCSPPFYIPMTREVSSAQREGEDSKEHKGEDLYMGEKTVFTL